MTGIPPEAVIARLSQRIAEQTVELAMHNIALEAAHARIAELEAAAEQVEETSADDPAA